MNNFNKNTKELWAEEVGLHRWDDEENAGIGWYGVYRWENCRWELENGIFLEDGCRQIVASARSFKEAVGLLKLS